MWADIFIENQVQEHKKRDTALQLKYSGQHLCKWFFIEYWIKTGLDFYPGPFYFNPCAHVDSSQGREDYEAV